ncbi:MAG: hypothetical protein ABNH00_12535 [Dokdonia sp.]|jgi:hypothetical protein
MRTNIIKNGFLLAGIMNMSVLLFSKFFNNPVLAKYDPEVMSNFGLLMILMWGLAYITVARKFASVAWLVGVFAIEKFIYGYHWISWQSSNSVAQVYREDVLAGIFYGIYGLNDLIFCLFFAYVFVHLMRATSS